MGEPKPTLGRRDRRWSLQREYVRLLVLAVLVPTLLLAGLALWRDVHSRQQQLSERLGAVAQFSARTIDEFLISHRGVLELVAERRSLEGPLVEYSDWAGDLARLRKLYRGFVTLLVSDAEGVVRISEPLLAATPQRVRRVDDRAYFREPARTGAAYISDVFRGRAQGTEPLVAVSAPLMPGGRFAGVLEGSIPVATFATINEEFLLQRGYVMLLLDRNGDVIHASAGLPFVPVSGLGTGAPAQAIRALRPFSAASEPTVIQGVLPGGADAYAAKATLQAGWQLVLLAPAEVLARELRLQALTLLGLLSLVLLAGLAASWRQLRLLTGSVNQLLHTLERFAIEHVEQPIAPDAMPRELAPLALALNETSARLGNAYSAISRSLDEQTALRASLEITVAEREREVERRTAQLREAVAELERLSRTDALTGCANYRAFRDLIATFWQEARDTGRPLSLLALDIDHFKDFNDQYGHQSGDHALARFAGAVRSALFHGSDVLARTGGEEFMVFLPGITFEQALLVGERVRQRVRDADIVHGQSPEGRLTVSIGVATMTVDDVEADDILKRADAALYRAKHAGRNRVSP